MNKKIVSILICIAMVGVSVITAFANTGSPTLLTDSTDRILTEVPTIEEMMDSYSEVGFEVELVKQDRSTAEYIMTSNEDLSFQSHILASVDLTGNQLLRITEGEKYDEVQFCTDGRILLNGSPVTITSERISSNIGNPVIAPMAAHRMYYQEDAPYDTNSSYTKLVSTDKKNLTFNQVISTMTTGALVSIIAGALVTGNVPAAILAAVVTGLITWYKINDTKSKACSLIQKQYAHKTKGFNVSSSMSTYKQVVTYYAYTNYTGNIGTNTFWQVFTY